MTRAENKGIKTLSSEFTLHSPIELLHLGKWFASFLEGGERVALTGDLGAGKTTFAKGIGKWLQVEEEIISPTFVLLREYHKGKIPLLHYDLYRLEKLAELIQIGFLDQMESHGLKVVEWADKFPALAHCFDWWVDIGVISDNSRKVNLYSYV